MGLTFINATVTSPLRPKRKARVRLMVDSGAVYSVLPQRVWRVLGIKPKRVVEFELADGTLIQRGVGQANFIIEGVDAISPVVLGAERDEALLGAVTLESMGFVLNPLSRELQPMRMMLAHVAGVR